MYGQLNGAAQPLMHDPSQALLGQPEQQASVYVCNLGPETTKLTLYEKFGEYGGLKNIKILENEEGKCKGVAFVNYVNLETANRAIAAMNGASIGDRVITTSL